MRQKNRTGQKKIEKLTEEREKNTKIIEERDFTIENNNTAISNLKIRNSYNISHINKQKENFLKHSIYQNEVTNNLAKILFSVRAVVHTVNIGVLLPLGMVGSEGERIVRNKEEMSDKEVEEERVREKEVERVKRIMMEKRLIRALMMGERTKKMKEMKEMKRLKEEKERKKREEEEYESEKRRLRTEEEGDEEDDEEEDHREGDEKTSDEKLNEGKSNEGKISEEKAQEIVSIGEVENKVVVGDSSHRPNSLRVHGLQGKYSTVLKYVLFSYFIHFCRNFNFCLYLIVF